MQIFVRNTKCKTYVVEPSTTLSELMYLISTSPTNFPICRMKLMYSGKNIDYRRSETMSELGIRDDSTIFLSYRIGSCYHHGPCSCGCEDGKLRNKNPQDSDKSV